MLNDEVMNSYLHLLQIRDGLLTQAFRDRQLQRRCSLFFDIFFYDRLVSKGYNSVKKWTKNVDIFELDKVFIVYNPPLHWALIILYPQRKLIEYRDSLRKLNNKYIIKLTLVHP